MEVQKSESFLYFQQKASHYNNLAHVKSVLHGSHNFQKSVQKQKKRQGTTSILESRIKEENNHSLLLRLLKISQSRTPQVMLDGNYSRNNKNLSLGDKKYKNKNAIFQKEIERNNKMFLDRLCKTRPVVACKNVWVSEHRRHLSHRNNVSRFIKGEYEKGPLCVSTHSFVPKHYREYLEQISPEKSKFTVLKLRENSSKTSLKETRKEKNEKGLKVLVKKKLAKLPKITYNYSTISVLMGSRTSETFE